MNKKYWLLLAGLAFLLLTVGLTVWLYRDFLHIKQPRAAWQSTNETPELDYAKQDQAEENKALTTPNEHRSLNLPILMYHHIGYAPANGGKIRNDLTVSPENFKAQVYWLKTHGYHSVKFADLYDYFLGTGKLPDKPIILSFDDGYQDAFDNALPILREAGFSGSFAIITQYPSTHSGTNFYADWNTIKSAANEGMEIVSHTQDHFDGKNPKYTEAFILSNLKGSREDIFNHLGLSTETLVYPYGRYTSKYIELAKQAGFKLGVTVHWGNKVDLDNLMEIPRVRVHNTTTIEQFALSLEKK